MDAEQLKVQVYQIYDAIGISSELLEGPVDEEAMRHYQERVIAPIQKKLKRYMFWMRVGLFFLKLFGILKWRQKKIDSAVQTLTDALFEGGVPMKRLKEIQKICRYSGTLGHLFKVYVAYWIDASVLGGSDEEPGNDIP